MGHQDLKVEEVWREDGREIQKIGREGASLYPWNGTYVRNAVDGLKGMLNGNIVSMNISWVFRRYSIPIEEI
jgi:hypothetical protein